MFLLGATGTIGGATVRALVARGHDVVCLVRPHAAAPAIAGATFRHGDATDAASLAQDGLRGERFDVLVSCMASRSGVPRDAWAVDHRAHVLALRAAQDAGVGHVVQLSAICLQKPRLAFQHAKLAYERVLADSGVDYTIVRPTAYFKSLSGQLARLRQGKPYLLFGDGALTACKPIADDDLAAYIADCIDDPKRRNRVLPIGGPGAPVTPRQQGERLFALLGRRPAFRHVPVALLGGVAAVLGVGSRVLPRLAAKAELARIGRYYATESMLVWDAAAGRYDAAATPATGSRTLFDHYADLVSGAAAAERGDHAVF